MRLYFSLVLALSLWSAAARADYLAGLHAMQARDFPAAYSEWLTAAEAGDARAQCRLAQLCELGIEMPRNWERAYHWYSRAAEGEVAAAAAARDDLASRMGPAHLAKARQTRVVRDPGPEPDSAAMSPAEGAWQIWLFTNLGVGRCQRIIRVIDLVIDGGKTAGQIVESQLGPHAYSGEIVPRDSSLRMIALGQEQVRFFGRLGANEGEGNWVSARPLCDGTCRSRRPE